MDIHEMFENFAKHKKETTGVDIKSGVDIVQDYEKLSKITEFNYDIHNIDFVKYFESRTGIMITKMEKDYKELLHCDTEPEHDHTLTTKQRLQNCWRIWNAESRG